MINAHKQGKKRELQVVFPCGLSWRVTLLSIQGKSLKILPKGVMKRMKEIRSQTTPVYGIVVLWSCGLSLWYFLI